MGVEERGPLEGSKQSIAGSYALIREWRKGLQLEISIIALASGIARAFAFHGRNGAVKDGVNDSLRTAN
jgi:hypothetical protein